MRLWKEVHGTVYHDEVMKEYASQQLKEERKRRAEAAVPSVRTSKFLRQDAFFKGFLELLVEIDQYYKRIYPFQSMFYEFIQKGDKAEYRAAIKLLKEIADENRAEGRIIEKIKYSWDLTSRNVTHNIGRLRLKRYLSVMANRKLRKQYFEF